MGYAMRQQMQKFSNFFQGKPEISILLVTCCLLANPAIASAQIVPDATLPNNSITTPSGDAVEITGGTTAGTNLFHSFNQFSIPTGGTAFFNNAATIKNIISRVTGGSISEIDGLIRANGGANLFLLNPKGIIFGPNAALNIGGSFIGSTANSIKFADDTEFSATNPQNQLLTVNVPLGLQYGSNPAAIVVQGAGSNLTLNPENYETIRDWRPVGLQVQPGQTLALVGGNVELEGGNLTAADGRIEIGSVGARGGTVKLNPIDSGWALSYEGVENFQDIRLSQTASVDASGDGGGDIQIQGRTVTLTEGAAVLTDTLGAGSGGMLKVRASEVVDVSGISENNPFYSGLFTNAASTATGEGGNLVIETPRLQVADGAQIGAITFGAGNAGTLKVLAEEVNLSGVTWLGPSALFAAVAPGGVGNANNLTIETDRLQLSEGAQIAASTYGAGNAGTLTVKAKQVELIGATSFGLTSIAANVEPGASGKGGNLVIESDRLRITNGAQVSTGSFGFADAGNLTLRAKDVEVSGISPTGASGLFTATADIGQGGNLTVESDRVRVTDGAQLVSGTFGSGKAGDLTIRASEFVELSGTSEFSRSGLFTSAIFGTGDGGELRIFTDKLTISNGATISASNFSSLDPTIPPGQGKAGNIQVEANSILLDTQGSLTTATASGEGGNMSLAASDSLLLLNNSQISTEAGGTGNGGNIAIRADLLVALDNSDIVANAFQGRGGNIQIATQGMFLSPDSQITASSQFGVDGVIEVQTPDDDPNQGLVIFPQQVVDVTNLVAQGCGARQQAVSEFKTTGRGGLPFNPANTLMNETVVADLGKNVVTTASNNTGKTSPAPTTKSQPKSMVIEAQGWIVNSNRQVILTANASEVTPAAAGFANVQCTR